MPNVLVIVLDTIRTHNLSVEGYALRTTPELERFARTGVLFERAMSTAPWTLPSHASIFTGRFHHELSTDWKKPLDKAYPTLAEVLSARGYLTAGFVANIYYCGYESGLNRGFFHYADYSVSLGQIMISSSLVRAVAKTGWFAPLIGYLQDINRKTAPEVNQEFLAWLSENNRRPFFAFLNYFDGHNPYVSSEPFDGIFDPDECGGEIDPCPQDGSELDSRFTMSAYNSTIAYLDHHLGRLIHELEKQGVLKNTLIIITSDHGEEFGMHGLWDHGNSLYLPSLHVPLLISLPARIPQGMRVREPVSLRDIPATVMDLLNLKRNPRFPGTSLPRYWSDGAIQTAPPNV